MLVAFHISDVTRIAGNLTAIFFWRNLGQSKNLDHDSELPMHAQLMRRLSIFCDHQQKASSLAVPAQDAALGEFLAAVADGRRYKTLPDREPSGVLHLQPMFSHR